MTPWFGEMITVSKLSLSFRLVLLFVSLVGTYSALKFRGKVRQFFHDFAVKKRKKKESKIKRHVPCVLCLITLPHEVKGCDMYSIIGRHLYDYIRVRLLFCIYNFINCRLSHS